MMSTAPTAAPMSTIDPGVLLARDGWSRGELVACQRERLRSLLRHAAGASPYYREVLGANAEDAELASLPTLSKATLMSEFDRIVTDRRIRRDDVEKHASGPDAGKPLFDDYRVFSTSGSSGRRGLVVFRSSEFAALVACCLRVLMRAGVRPGTRLAAIGAPHALHVTRQLFATLRSGRSNSPELAVTAPLTEMIKALDSYQPEAIATYPSIAGQIAVAQIDGRLRIAPRTVAVGSEVLTEDVERAVETAWGIKPLNVYAATEAPLIAAGSPEHAGLHISEDVLIVESVDERGDPVPPGIPGNKVLLTNLVNYTQPLIRYELSDSIVLAPEPDAGEWPYARIERVDGRSDDILQMRDRAGRPVAVHPYRLRVPFVALSEVRRYQLLFDGKTLTVRLVLDPSAPRETPDLIGAAMTNAIESAGAVPPPVKVTPVDSIEREPGHAAKFKLVKLV